nr:hypothetical protein [Pseudomonas poae]
MSVIDCDYLPADKVVFPPELALLIVRKASAMAAVFEEQALDQFTKDALRALSQSVEPRRVIRETLVAGWRNYRNSGGHHYLPYGNGRTDSNARVEKQKAVRHLLRLMCGLHN